VLLERRPPKGLLGGMLGFPGTPWAAKSGAPMTHAPANAQWRKLDVKVVHTFTHFRLTLDVFRAETAAEDPALGIWHPAAGLAEAGLPGVMRKIGDAALGGDGPLFGGG
jgi:A/G-specific adenine glycosylase